MATNTDGVLVQANFKTPRGSLLNVYGQDEQSFDLGLAILIDRVRTIAEIEAHLNGASSAAAVITVDAAPVPAAPAAPAAAPGWGAAPAPAAPPAAFAAATVPMCEHGARTIRSGQSAKGPWKAAFCPTPKDTVGQCDPIFFKQGSPEWNAN